MKNLERKDFYKKSGIYAIKSLIDDRIYIGSSSCLYSRINYHLDHLRRNSHTNSKLQRFFNKYGEDKMSIEVLQIVENINELISIETDIIKSKNIFDLLNIEMNPMEPNRSAVSDETKRKLKETWAKDDGTRRAIVLKNIKKAQQNFVPQDGSNWIGRKHSEDSKKKMSESAKKRKCNSPKVKVSRYTKDGEYIDSFESITEASLKCFGTINHAQNIGSVCNNKRKYCKGFIFKKDE